MLSTEWIVSHTFVSCMSSNEKKLLLLHNISNINTCHLISLLCKELAGSDQGTNNYLEMYILFICSLLIGVVSENTNIMAYVQN